jgi:hypothetical protein
VEYLWRWAAINSGFVMREYQSFDTNLKRSRDLTGSLVRISVIISSGRMETEPSTLFPPLMGMDRFLDEFTGRVVGLGFQLMERRSKLGWVERRKILMPIYKFRVSTKDLYILNILPTYFFFFLDIVISLSSPVYQSHPNC